MTQTQLNPDSQNNLHKSLNSLYNTGMTKLFLDFETYSPVDISRTLANYCPQAEVLMTAWAIDDGPVRLWCSAENEPMPKDLYDAVHDPDVWLVAHNASFEYQIIKHTGIFGPQDIPLERFYCTQAQALEHNLPASLGDICKVYQLGEDVAKLRDGKALVKWFCTPGTAGKFRGMQPADKWQRFKEYCVNDVVSMRILHNSIPRVNFPFDNNHVERKLWLETERMNQAGFGVDLDLARAAITMTERLKESIDYELAEVTDGVVTSPNQTAALKKYIEDAYDVKLDNMQAATLEKAVDDMSLPVGAREVIQTRIDSSKASVAKYKKLVQCADSRGRMTGTIVFCGASGTGRDAGRTFQPQNLPRPASWFDDEHAEQLIEEIKDQSLDLTHKNPMAVMSSALRGSIIPAAGKKLVVSDLSNIEGRMVAWLAGEDWKVQYFRDYDAGLIKFDNYVAAASKMLGMNPEDVDKTTRQTGKVMELACFGSETKVLTNTGVKNILDVCSTDLLWDGVEWVKHEGLVYKGQRETIRLDGVAVTPEHQVLASDQWIDASLAASDRNMLNWVLATGSESLQSLATSLPSMACLQLRRSECSVHAEQTPTPSIQTTCDPVGPHGATYAPRSNLPTQKRSITDTPTSCQTPSIDEGYSVGWPQPSTDARIQTTDSTTDTEVEVSEFMRRGSAIKDYLLRMSSLSTDGTTLISTSTEKTTTKGMNPETCASVQEKKTQTTSAPSDLYKLESKSLKPVYDLLNCGSRNRFTVISNSGALLVHNCGYGSGVGGIMQFAEVYRVDLNRLASETHKIADGSLWFSTQEKYSWAQEKGFDYKLPIHQWTACDYLKQQWRNAHRNIAQLWNDCELAFRMAYITPDVWFPAGKHLAYKRKGTWIFCRLPSGRVLSYIQPKIIDDEITYMCMDQMSNKWTRTKIYAGKFVAHATQASARDLLLQNMLKAKKSGYTTILRVHDELITEVPDSDNFNAEGLGSHLASNLPWCPDLPLAAAGYETNVRYKKD